MQKKAVIRAGIIASILLLTIQAALAQQENTSFSLGIYRVNSIEIDIKDNGLVDVKEEIVVDKPEVLILLPDTRGLRITDARGEIEYTPNVISDKQIVGFKPNSYFPSSDGKVLISYTSNHLTQKSGSLWTLRFFSPATPTHTEVVVSFPQGTNILELRSNDPRYPAILVSPLRIYPQENQFSFECDYEVEERIGAGPIPLEVIATLLIIILIISLIFIVSKRRKSDETANQEIPSTEKTEEQDPGEGGGRRIKESVLNMLEKRERDIIDVIEKSGDDEITQAYVYKTTGIPKATLSDIMRRLENRNIIERRNDGRTKWINLKEWIFD